MKKRRRNPLLAMNDHVQISLQDTLYGSSSSFLKSNKSQLQESKKNVILFDKGTLDTSTYRRVECSRLKFSHFSRVAYDLRIFRSCSHEFNHENVVLP